MSARTLSGRPSGRPTRRPASSGSIIGASPAWPGVSRMTSGRPRPSTAAWIFVAQPAARPAESVIARFVPAAARFLVIQPSPYVLFEPRTILPNNTFGGGRVLMRPHDRGIDRRRPIDPASSVGLGLDHSQQHVPGPIGSETMMPPPHRLPRAESLGKITPRPPCDIATQITPAAARGARLGLAYDPRPIAGRLHRATRSCGRLGSKSPSAEKVTGAAHHRNGAPASAAPSAFPAEAEEEGHGGRGLGARVW